MEDDWASPWADAEDRSSSEVIRNLDVKCAKDAGRAGIDILQSRITNSNVAVHTNDPWSSGEHGFGDALAWAGPSPTIGSGEIPGVVGGSGLLRWSEPVAAGASSFVTKRTAERAELPSAIEGEQPEAKKEEWLGATDDADVWAAGSDREDAKTLETSELSVNRKLSLAVAHEIKLPLGFNALTEGVDKEGLVRTEGHKEGQPTDAKILGNKPIKSWPETNTGEELITSEITSTEQAPPIPKTASVQNLVTKHEGGFRRETETIQAEVRAGDDEDEFGDFADEEYYEGAEGDLSKDIDLFAKELPPSPQTPSLNIDIPFNIDTSLLKKLYPILTGYPEPPPLEEIIHTTGSRKAWYRLSHSGTIRKDRSGDDDYVRVTWGGSKIQEDVNKIVARWMAEDRSTGGCVALGGPRRLGAVFGWGESVESVKKTAPPAQMNLSKGSHSRENSHGSGATSEQPGDLKSPFGISATRRPAENETVPSPQTVSFGWSSPDNPLPTVESHPGSSSNSVKSDEKLPPASDRASIQSTSSRISSQPVAPSRSVVSRSTITSSHSNKHSHSVAATRPSSPSPKNIQGTAEEIATTPIIPALSDSPLSSALVASTSVGQPTASLSSSNFNERGAFENIATTVKLPSTTEANCGFDEWGTFECLVKPVYSKPAGSVSGKDQTPALFQPLKTSDAEEQALGLNNDEWSTFAGPLPAPETPTPDGLSEKSPAHASMKQEEQPGSKGQRMDNRRSSVGSLASKPPVPEQLSVQLPAHVPIESGLKPLGGLGPDTQRSDEWGSFDASESASEGSMTPKPPASTTMSTRASEESSRRSVEAPDPKTHNSGNWGSFGTLGSTLTPKSTSNQPPRNLPTHVNQEKTKLAEKLSPKAQNKSPWSSFDGPETPRSKETGNSQRPMPIMPNGKSTKPVVPPILPAPVATGDDDDWGEMVQSPTIPTVNSPFSTVLQPTLSHNNTPRIMSPVSFQDTQQKPQALTPSVLSTTSMFDFGSFEKLSAPQKTENTMPHNGSGGSDTWDLSCFESPIPSTSTPVNVSALVSSSSQTSSDLWDTLPPEATGWRENAKEKREIKLVNQVIEGLPDLSYMLQ